MKQLHTLRIIGGQWRGRRLAILPETHLRPTPDRVRETLFNWLTPYLNNARCLDLFAGTGALGFEAMSRGAKSVTMIDASPLLLTHLQKEATKLKASNIQFYQGMLPLCLDQIKPPFDIIFVDPPYQTDLLFQTCDYLQKHHFLALNGFIYLEANKQIQDNELPQTWRMLKAKRAGQVFYHLATREK